MKIDLLWLTEHNVAPTWSSGNVFCIPPAAEEVATFVQKNLANSLSDAWLFWDSSFPLPLVNLLQEVLAGTDDVWHAGLRLGTSGQPDFIDYVSPTWMLNCDPDPGIQAASWRLSLRACLLRTDTMRRLGGPLHGFATLNASGLEMGFRYIRKGAFLRYIPDLLTPGIQSSPTPMPVEDQLRFIKAGFGTKWLSWAVIRAVSTGKASPGGVYRAWNAARQFASPAGSVVNKKPLQPDRSANRPERVSVLIPTLNRYPYLRNLLGQLRSQTFKPFEILVIDQTPESGKNDHIRHEFSDLPLRWFTMDQAGQCSSRNLGLQQALGDHILFIDDDDEIPADLIESHLKCLRQYCCRVSSGVARETGIESLPADFTFVRTSNVFPTNNSMILKAVLQRSGLFDLAYDRGQRADGDLGMRIYLSGEKMVLNPEISVFHHHAPQGGLRQHKARVKTHAASRKKINLRVLPSVSDIYLARRYFTGTQVHEMLWISVLGTFSLHGPHWKQALKVLFGVIALPYTLYQIRSHSRIVKDMLNNYPQIPRLEDQ